MILVHWEKLNLLLTIIHMLILYDHNLPLTKRLQLKMIFVRAIISFNNIVNRFIPIK